MRKKEKVRKANATFFVVFSFPRQNIDKRIQPRARKSPIYVNEVSLARLTHLSAEAAEEGVPKVTEREREVLVEEVPQELADSEVRPTAVHQKQALEESELSDAVIGGKDGLHAFLTRNAHADVRRFDHGDVIGAVADGQRHRLLVLFDELDHEGLLKRRHAAADDGVAALGHLQEKQLHLFGEREHERVPGDDEGKAGSSVGLGFGFFRRRFVFWRRDVMRPTVREVLI